MIYSLLVALGLSAGSVQDQARLGLLASNEIQRHAHMTGDAKLFASMLGDSMLSVDRGQFSRSSRAAIEQRFAAYFPTLRYRSWDDMRPPDIQIAADGSLATMTVQKLVVVEPVTADGTPADPQHTQFAWQASYAPDADGRWQVQSTAGSRQELSAEEAAAAAIAMSSEYAVIAEPELVPEGVAHDSLTDTIFVSSTYGRKIVAVDADGSVRDFKSEAEDGLWSALGMEVDASARALWVVSGNLHEVLPMRIPEPETHWRSELLRFDLDSGRLAGRFGHADTERSGLNDVTVTDAGEVYVTDSVRGQVLQVDTQSQQLRAIALDESIVFPNGITHDDRGVLYVSHRQGVRMIDPVSGRQSELQRPDWMVIEGFDGLAWHAGTLIGNQPHRQRILELTLSDDGASVLSQRILEANHPAFDQPSTGEVVVDTGPAGNPRARFVYLANAQMRSAFEWQNAERGAAETTLRPREELEDVLLLSVDLTGSYK